MKKKLFLVLFTLLALPIFTGCTESEDIAEEHHASFSVSTPSTDGYSHGGGGGFR